MEFRFSISPSNEHPGLISFRIDCLDLLAVQGTLKSLLQHHSTKASIQHSAFFMVQFSHPYMTTGKTIALTRWNFISKVMSLLFNMLSRLVITFLSNGIKESCPSLHGGEKGGEQAQEKESSFYKSLHRPARRSNQSILKEISPGCSLEGLMLKLKLQYFGHLTRRTDSLGKTVAGKD